MKSATKRKTSVTLSPEVVRRIDQLAGKKGSRSGVIEQAVLAFWAAQVKRRRDMRDREILDTNADRLNEEAEDVLTYQVDL